MPLVNILVGAALVLFGRRLFWLQLCLRLGFGRLIRHGLGLTGRARGRLSTRRGSTDQLVEERLDAVAPRRLHNHPDGVALPSRARARQARRPDRRSHL